MRSLSVTLLGLLLPAALSAQSCASTEIAEQTDAAECNTPDCLAEDAASDAGADTIEAGSTPPPDAPQVVVSQCGTGCSPDDATACADFRPDDGADAGDDPIWGCGVTRASAGSLRATCIAAGTGTVTDLGLPAPCGSGADCAPGYACIAFEEDQALSGLCRPYCCEGTCADEEMYCTERPLLSPENTSPGEPLQVPVCVRAENCRLDEVCDGGTGCSCPSGTACTVVGKNGLTGCVSVSPEAGAAAGEKCPCAAGFVCSSASQTCLEVCSLTDPASCDEHSKCQANPALPDGFGTCTVGSLEPAY